MGISQSSSSKQSKKSFKLLPGSLFPSIIVKLINGNEEDLSSIITGKDKLIVVYRGAFCPFCKGTLDALQANLNLLEAAQIDVIAISADALEVAKESSDSREYTFRVGYGLTEPQMKALGLYISEPTNYIPQTQKFAEPGYFYLNQQDGTIKYIDISSHPMGGRINVDNLIAGINFVRQNVIDHPEFKSVVWGSK